MAGKALFGIMLGDSLGADPSYRALDKAYSIHCLAVLGQRVLPEPNMNFGISRHPVLYAVQYVPENQHPKPKRSSTAPAAASAQGGYHSRRFTHRITCTSKAKIIGPSQAVTIRDLWYA